MHIIGRLALILSFSFVSYFFSALSTPHQAYAQPNVTALSCTPPTTDAKIASLARALNYDFDLIYEYVYYNVDFYPTFGSTKGALGTYLDSQGTNIDQNVLFVTLLRQSCINANYRYADVTLPGDMVASLFGVENSAGLLASVLGKGGIPACVQLTSSGPCVTSGGAASNVTMTWVFTEATVGAATYLVDPSLKSHHRFTPIDVGTAMNYDQTTFLNAAKAGSSPISGVPAGIDSIKTINRDNIRSNLNTYSENLMNIIDADEPVSSTDEIFGGVRITSENYGVSLPAGGTLYTELPEALEIVFTYSLSNNVDGSAPVTTNLIIYGSQLAGRRLSLRYANNKPTFYVNETAIVTGPAASAGASQTVNMTVTFPYASPFNVHTVRPRVKVGGTYALIFSAGEQGRYGLSVMQRSLAQGVKLLTSAGLPLAFKDLGLDIIGHTYVAQTSEAGRFYANLSKVINAYHAFMGIAGAAAGGTSYVDFPGQLGSIAAAATTVTQNDLNGLAAAIAYFGSTLESTTISQLQLTEAVSTVRMFDYANQSSIGFLQATPTNWSVVKPLLTNWSAADISSMETYLTGDPASLVILPQDGNRTVGTWSGAGYYFFRNSGGLQNIAYLISGSYKGAFSTSGSYDFSSPAFVSVPASINRQFDAPMSWDPINLQNGNYIYENEDINVGSAAFPYGLALRRSYNSADINNPTAMGYGWRHNFMMSAKRDSDTFEAFGKYNPRSAIPFVVAFHAVKNISSTPTTILDNVAISSLSASWLMDQLVDNAITLALDKGTKRFMRVPSASGGAVYVSPPGEGSTLEVNADQTITLTDKTGTVSRFDADGFLTSWTDTNANVVSFTYTGTGAAKLLNKVSNGMGRTLTFTYASRKVKTVSDGTRSVSYTYVADGTNTSATIKTFTDTRSNITTFGYSTPINSLLVQIKYPAFASVPAVKNVYDGMGHIVTQTDALNNVWTYLFANGVRSQEVDPAGGARTLYFDRNGNQTKNIDQDGEATLSEYDGIGRLTKVTGPLGDKVAIVYDAKSNVLSKTITPIPGAIDRITGLPATPVNEVWTYDPIFNKPLTYTDALGRLTSYAYDANRNLLTTTQPPVAKPGIVGLVSPVITATYGARGLPATLTDADGRVTKYTYSSTTFDLLSTVQDFGIGRLNLTTVVTYDAIGNKLTSTDPRGFKTTFGYNMGRLLNKITPGAPFAANITKFSYDSNGNRETEERATGATAPAWRKIKTTYNAANKPILIEQPDATTKAIGYDPVGRVTTETSSSGRRVTYGYDLASRLISIQDGVSGTLDPSITQNLGTVTRETRTYYPGSGGLLATRADGNGNALTYLYDGFRRADQISYPGSTAAAPDDEVHSFDAAGNDLVFQRRDGSQIWFTYDALNRVTTKAPAGQPTITYGYDYTGNLLTAQATGDTTPTQISYDSAGRKIGETTPAFGAVTASLDANGNQTGLIWPGGGYTVSSGIDQLNRLTGVFEGSVATGVRIAGYTYNTLSERKTASFGPATAPVASSALTYTTMSQIATFGHTWNGSSLLLTYTYNKDHQRSKLVANDNTYLPTGLAPASVSYTRNALNQYTAVGATTYSYDGRGNLTGNGVWTFGYDIENRLVSATKSGTSISYAYDALGRRLSKTVNGVTTSWASYGNREIAEYQGTGTPVLQSRTVFGPGFDEPIASISPANVRTYLFQDALGSVIALANASGQVTEKYAYTAYGLNTVIGSGSSAYRYAGRRFEPETGLYYNRARAYSPALGRFLQTDPIGTDGGINLYAYTGNDPVNNTDPAGHRTVSLGLSAQIAYGVGFGGGVSIDIDFPWNDGTRFDVRLGGSISGLFGYGAGGSFGPNFNIPDSLNGIGFISSPTPDRQMFSGGIDRIGIASVGIFSVQLSSPLTKESALFDFIDTTGDANIDLFSAKTIGYGRIGQGLGGFTGLTARGDFSVRDSTSAVWDWISNSSTSSLAGASEGGSTHK